MAALHLLLAAHRHVVAEVVESELVVRAVGDVSRVLGPLVVPVVVVGNDQADRQTHEAVDAPHPLRVAGGEVVVHRDDVDALAGETVEIHRKRRDERLALTGLHLGDPTEVQRCATHELHVVVTLADHAGGGLAGDRKGFDEQAVEVLTPVETLTELSRLGLEQLVGELLQLRFVGADVGDEVSEGADLAVLARAEKFVEDSHRWASSYRSAGVGP